ncbi:hypothetical protein ACOMHN_064937 [Nucella lapillus]
MSDSEMTYSADHVQRLLQCSVCLDRFRQPKLLPCQHTFCLSPCLEGLVDRRTRFLRCPECRADHLVPRGGPSHFPNNLTIISFLELPRVGGERPSSASSASVSTGASSRPDPEIPLSSSAPSRLSALERTDRLGVGNSRMGLGAAGVEGSVGGGGGGGGIGGGGGCSSCHTEGRLGRCSHCDQLLCELCKRAHMDMVRTDVNRLVGQVRQALPQITEQINQIGRKGVQLQNTCENLKAEVAEVVDKHLRELKLRQRLLKDDVDNFLVSELRGLRSHQESLEVELASMASFCDSTEATLSRSRHLTDGDLVELRRHSMENIETLRDYENGTLRPPVPRNIQLSAESHFMSTTISNFGELIITSGSSSIHARGAAAAAGRDPGLTTERRTTLRTPETATDYALSVLSSSSPSLSPNILRHQRFSSPPPRASARSSQVNFTDEDLYDDEEVDEVEHSLPRLDVRRRHWRDRREHHSDTRIAGLLGRSSDLLLSRQSRNLIRRNRSLGALPPSHDTSDHSESSPEREVPERATRSRRRTTFENPEEEDDVELVGIGRAPSLTYPPARSARASLRFDVPPDTSSETEDTAAPPARRRHEDNQAYMMWADNSPSMYVTTPRNKYNQKGQAMTRFGERGNGPQQFSWPRGVAVSPLDDDIFVADSSNHRVQIFNNTGSYTRTFGGYGQGEGEFDCLAGITVNGLGQIIIADRYNHRIQIFDRSCNFQRSFGSEGSNDGQLNYPWGVACDNMGFIYVCDKENHRVQVFQSNGSFVRKFGRLGSSTGHFDNPHYLAVSPDNKVYVSDSSNHRVQVFSIYGDFLFSFGSCGTLRGQMKFPRGIAIDNQGFVVVADSGNNRVQIFRADGRYYSMFGAWGSENGQFKGLEGSAILANGNVVVTDRENHRIQIF